MAVWAVVNQKGGVGKTTVTLGLADAAVAAGLRCLVVDIDPQANATSGLAVWEPAHTVDEALEREVPGAARSLVARSGWPGDAVPDVIASRPALARVEPLLASDPIGASDRLRVALEGVDHDVVIIDCPPSLGLLSINGLFAADRALVVTEPGAWALDGVDQIVRTIERIADRRRTPLTLAGIVANRVGRTRDAQYWQRQLQERYPDDVLPSIALRAAITEASAQSLPVRALGKRPGAAEAAAELDALLARLLDGDVRRAPGAADDQAEVG